MADGLSLERLAATAGLPRARVQDLCQRFADCLPATGPRGARVWAPEQVAVLRNIHVLDSAGYTVEAIRLQFAVPLAVASEVAAYPTGPGSGASPRVDPVEPELPLPLEEALRTLGVGLDRHEVVRLAQFTIDNQGIMVDAVTPYVHMLHTWNALLVESASQRQARQSSPRPAPDADLLALTRWTVLLRLVGVLLDADHVRRGTLQVEIARPETPTSFDVQVETDAVTRSLHDDVQHLLLRRRAQYARRSTPDDRGPAPGATAARRRWWSRA